MDQTLSSSSAHVSTLIDSNSNSRTNGSISNGSHNISPGGNNDVKKTSPKTKTTNKSNNTNTTTINNNKTHEIISLIDSSQELKESINDDDGKHSNSNTGKRMGDNSPIERNAKTIKLDDEKEVIQAVQEQGGSRGHLGATSGMKVSFNIIIITYYHRHYHYYYIIEYSKLFRWW
jgi:hypothetical protein